MSTSISKLCSICAPLNLERSDFTRPPFEPEGRYNSLVLSGSLGYLRSNKHSCSLCHLIFHALYKNEGQSIEEQGDATEWEMTWSQNNQEYDPESNEAEDLYGSGLYPRLKSEESHTDHCIQLVDEASTDGFLRGRLIPETIDAAMIRGWMDLCTEMHGKNCKQSYLRVETVPAVLMSRFMVIDVQKECLVTMPSGAKYVALSYVWGQASFLTTVKSLVSEFQTEGAFVRTKPPKTIQDAINLTRALEFQYLWVDALCIVQDDDSTKRDLINSMDAVYGYAALTIVAASGRHSDAGLLGWRSCPPERQLVTESLGSELRLGVLTAFDATMMKAPHSKRGWTYQEGCLSARCLVILDGQAFFSCRVSVWREDVHAEISGVKPFEGANVLGRTPSPWPLRRYSQTVQAYTMRQLTYPSDILNAFIGMMSAMTTSMAGTWMDHGYGLPPAAFDWAILWTGHLTLRNLKRSSGSMFPSWAWVGWEGEISMAGDTYSSFDQQWLRTRTWIEWYRILENGELVLMWDPERDGSTISTLSIDGVENIGAGSDGEAGDGCNKEEIDYSDEEDDTDVCPTYGIPFPHNPYGRNINPQLLSSLPTRPDSMQCMPPTQFYSKPGTLVFSTVVASFILDSSSTPIKGRSSIFRLLDATDQMCGFIWEDQSPANSEPKIQKLHTQETRQILLLSHSSPGTSYMFKGADIGFADEYQPKKTREESENALSEGTELDGEEIFGEWHSWDFFNVILVAKIREKEGQDERKPYLYERDGVGFLHKNAIKKALNPEPCWRMVGLI